VRIVSLEYKVLFGEICKENYKLTLKIDESSYLLNDAYHKIKLLHNCNAQKTNFANMKQQDCLK